MRREDRGAEVRRVFFISQRRAEAMIPRRTSAIISITDPDQPAASLSPGWGCVIRTGFHDVDPITFPGLNQEMHPLTPEQASGIVTALSGLPSDITTLVVHCKSGVSRSAGVAKAIAEAYDIRFPPDYFEYNRHVYEVLREAFSGVRVPR